jgi:hypothetical protein
MRKVLFIILALLSTGPVQAETDAMTTAAATRHNIVIVSTAANERDREIAALKDEIVRNKALQEQQIRMLQAADRGEAVFFKGVGEARMGRDNGRSVIRFAAEMAERADRLFLPIRAVRFAQGKYVYYALDFGALAF